MPAITGIFILSSAATSAKFFRTKSSSETLVFNHLLRPTKLLPIMFPAKDVFTELLIKPVTIDKVDSYSVLQHFTILQKSMPVLSSPSTMLSGEQQDCTILYILLFFFSLP